MISNNQYQPVIESKKNKNIPVFNLEEINNDIEEFNSKNINNNHVIPTLSSNLNSGTKGNVASQISLAFDSNVQSKEKVNLDNNFNNNIKKTEKINNPNSTKFSDFLKLKKAANISKNINNYTNNVINGINEALNLRKNEINSKKISNNDYELDLHTLEETYNEFYDLKKVKKNPFIPFNNNQKANINYKKNNTSVGNSNNTNVNANMRNKKDREKMNGYKCEMCENVKIYIKFLVL